MKRIIKSVALLKGQIGMKKIIIIFLIFCLFSECTCSSDKSDVIKNGDILTFKFDFDKEPVNIHDIGLIYDVEVLNLNCEEAIFEEINKILKYKNRIYLLDIWQTHSVIIYDTLGNFVNLIESFGQGPNEYIQLMDIFINHEDETLNLVSRVDRKVLRYDLDGNIIKVEKTPQMFEQFSKTPTGYVGYMANLIMDKPYNVWTLSNKMQLNKGFFEIDPTWNSKQISDFVFSNYEDKTYYTVPLDFNIYCLENDEFSIAYTFDFGKHAWPETHREFDKYKSLIRSLVHPISELEKFQETKNHIIAEVIHHGQTRLCIYNKQTNKTYVAFPDAYMDKYFFSFGKIISVDENAIYTTISAFHMKESCTGKNEFNDFTAKYPEQIKRLREKFPHIDEEGNPFLVIYYIK
jgi:hypothetical protein